MKGYGSKIVLGIIMLSLVLSGCGQTGTQDVSKAPEDVPGFYMTDSFGREVLVPDEVNNIAYLYSFAGYAVSLLGRGDDLVAVPNGRGDVLRGVNLIAEYGEVLAVVGLSGSGKSTLCYCMSGIVPHFYSGDMRGEVLIKGTPTSSMKIPEIATSLGIVFQ
jgi:ABC-type multidrug transport system fused ATPase/permease subunit